MPASEGTGARRRPRGGIRGTGEAYVWFCGAALSVSLLITALLLVVVARNGLGYFWPARVARAVLRTGEVVAGEITARDVDPATGGERLQFKIGNRDWYGFDFRWVEGSRIEKLDHPGDLVVLERREHGNFYGWLRGVKTPGGAPATGASAWELLGEGAQAPRGTTATFEDAGGRTGDIAVGDILRAYRPNAMSFGRKCLQYAANVVELLTAEPREANTEGGIFPALYGTVLLVFLMTLFCVPLGVVAAVYLHEYARPGMLVRGVRIAVNNLAGIPSIVYGVFGLGFFVYFVGGTIDRVFFPDHLPEPTYGTGGILWASLTLALLTVPVVIVSTEEGLASIPRGVREGSLALGATKLQTLGRVVLPMASPGIMTGMILSMARAAGEVAPLMLIGVVKRVEKLPLDGRFPFFHPSRKFMHLGFHIYDLGFQSPNVEAVLPMVYVTTMVLLGVVVAMSAAAILLRNRMRKRYTTGVF